MNQQNVINPAVMSPAIMLYFFSCSSVHFLFVVYKRTRFQHKQEPLSTHPSSMECQETAVNESYPQDAIRLLLYPPIRTMLFIVLSENFSSKAESMNIVKRKQVIYQYTPVTARPPQRAYIQ